MSTTKSIRIEVDVTCSMDREPDPNDQWDVGDTSGFVRDVRAYCSPMEPEEGDYARERYPVIAQKGQYIFVVVADYESGNTFGRSGGHYQVLDCFGHINEAAALVAAAQEVKEGYHLEHNGKDYYIDWLGYFERLQDIKVWAVLVQ